MEGALTAEGQQETREARGGGGRHYFCLLPQVVESFQPRTPWPSWRNFSGTKLSPRGPMLGLRMEGGGGGVPVWRPHFRMQMFSFVPGPVFWLPLSLTGS